MQDYERFIVPGLGVVILLSAFVLGVPLVHSLLLGLLGLAAVGEFELPVLNVFFFILLALGVSSIISVGLHRAIAAVIAATGMMASLDSYVCVVGLVENEAD